MDILKNVQNGHSESFEGDFNIKKPQKVLHYDTTHVEMTAGAKKGITLWMAHIIIFWLK